MQTFVREKQIPGFYYRVFELCQGFYNRVSELSHIFYYDIYWSTLGFIILINILLLPLLITRDMRFVPIPDISIIIIF